MSRTKSVFPATYAEIAPSCPAGIIAAFATMLPSSAFNVDTVGRFWPAGQSVRYPRGPFGTTVAFRLYAWATNGTVQGLCKTGIVRVLPLTKLGPPSWPVALRESKIRHGGKG